MNLYELSSELRAVELELEDLEAAEGELNGSLVPALFSRLEALNIDAEAALGSLTRWIVNLEAEAEMIAAEADRLSELSKRRKKKAEALRDYVLSFLQRHGMKKFDAGIRKLSVCAPKGSKVEVDPAAVFDWPEDVSEVVVHWEPKIDKNKLKALEGFEQLPGVTVIEGKEYLQIRK